MEDDGVVVVPNNFGACWRDEDFRDVGRTRNGRVIQTLTNSSSKKWKSLLTPEVVQILNQTMKTPAAQVIQRIVTKDKQEEQEVHRDHDLGPGKFLTLVFTTNEKPLTTWFQTGSHREKHQVLYRSTARKTDLQRRRTSMVQTGADAAIYDAYIMHCGAATTGENSTRIFASFVDLDCEKDELQHFNDVSFRHKNARYISVCDLLV